MSQRRTFPPPHERTIEHQTVRAASGEGLAVLTLSLAMVVALQIACGAYRSGFGGHPDEAAHFVTALMVRDFLASLDYRHARDFAVQYYLHYPKVALGHWPPVLYAAAGSWFVLFGASRAASLLFVAVTAAVTSSLIYWTGKRLIARWAGALAALLFLASPLAQESSARLMTEHLVTLGMLAATLSFARFSVTQRRFDGLVFGVLASLAILTRGSAWALAAVPALTIALTRKWTLLARAGLWLAALPVLLTCVPWYILTRGMIEGSWTGSGNAAPFWVFALGGFSRFLYDGAGLVPLLFAAAGFYAKIVAPWRRREVSADWAALAALAVATLALQCAVPASVEARFMVTLLPPIFLFTAAGAAVAARLSGFASPATAVTGLTLATVGAFAAQSFALPAHLRNDGFDAIAPQVAASLGVRPQVWMIASGSVGEGSLIAAVALQESRPASVLLRGSNILAKEDWLGRDSRDAFATPEALSGLLDELPVTVVVLDDRVPTAEHRPYHDRLRALITGDQSVWTLIGAFAVLQRGHDLPSPVSVYIRRSATEAANTPPGPDLRRISTLIGRNELR